MRGLHPFIFCANGILLYIVHECGSTLNLYLVIALIYFEMIFVVHYAYDRPLDAPEFVMCTIYLIMTALMIMSISASF